MHRSWRLEDFLPSGSSLHSFSLLSFDNMGLFKNIFTSSLMVWLFGGLVSANWDPATGHLYNYRPSKSWLSQQCKMFNDVQVAECAQNTRLSYPHVQVFATFQVEHSKDKNHGCPYGTCCGYADLPAPSDMEIDSMNYHSFFWQAWTNPIADLRRAPLGTKAVMASFMKAKRTSPRCKDTTTPTTAASSSPPPGPTSNIRPGIRNRGAYGNYTPAPGSSYMAPTGYST
ncbi:hypothetical protein PSHT_03093 [Puccinia striiformis]|uniref:Secreted protein n=1 Tax=Puccinia striiformis TaxID=27350 RepID=A0A2S4WGL7_9BASI|nr:hypothetical protein PSHT_03093 [Puccinia striiformis]